MVIVAHDSVSDLRHSLPPLIGQLVPGDELIVVDSGSGDELAERLPELAPAARLVSAGGNVGFAGGANLGAQEATGELLVLLNPDAVVQPGWVDAICRPWGGRYAAWMGLVSMRGGEAINTSGGVLHYTGIGWAGQAGEPIAAAPQGMRAVGFLSGACLAIPLATWRELGGFSAWYFMYCEDVDLSLRLRLRGGELAVLPDARVDHSYDFEKGLLKWRMLERNRWATIIRDYPAPLLALLLPGLVLAEVAVLLAAARRGWGRMKVLATLDVLRALPLLCRERSRIQRGRVVSSGRFASALTAELDSPYLGGLAAGAGVQRALRAYWSLVELALSARSA